MEHNGAWREFGLCFRFCRIFFFCFYNVFGGHGILKGLVFLRVIQNLPGCANTVVGRQGRSCQIVSIPPLATLGCT
jgi:hypothetical protein